MQPLGFLFVSTISFLYPVTFAKSVCSDIFETLSYFKIQNLMKNPMQNQLRKLQNLNSQGEVEVKEGHLFYQTFGRGNPIIVLHGGPGLNQEYFLPQMLELAKEHQVTFYDQRGSGKSLNASVDKQTVTVEQFVEDLETLRTKLGYKKFVLLGHSWGGLLALHYALIYQKRLDALILLNPCPATGKGYQFFVKEASKRQEPFKARLEEIQNSDQFKQGDTKLTEVVIRLSFIKYFANEKDVQKLSLNFTHQSSIGGFNVYNIFSNTYLSSPYDLRKSLNN